MGKIIKKIKNINFYLIVSNSAIISLICWCCSKNWLPFYLGLIILLNIIWYFNVDMHPRFFIVLKHIIVSTVTLMTDDAGDFDEIPWKNKRICFALTLALVPVTVLRTPLGRQLIFWPQVTSSGVMFFYLLLVHPSALNFTITINFGVTLFIGICFLVFHLILINKKSWYNKFYYTLYDEEETHKLLGFGDWTKEPKWRKKESTTFKGRKQDQNK